MCDHALEGEWPATAAGLDKVCCFASGDGYWSLPVSTTVYRHPPQKLLAHLRQLRQQGMDNPIAIGAIPFDTQSPCIW